MTELVRVVLEDGGYLLVEADGGGAPGPVKAGRAAVIEQLPSSLRTTLSVIAQASREVLAALKDAGPDEVKVEFGVKLSASAGALLTKGEAECHLKVTLGWSGGAAA